MSDNGIFRYSLLRVKNGYELYNKVTGATFEGGCREVLICKVSKHHGAKKVHRRKKSVIFNCNSHSHSH